MRRFLVPVSGVVAASVVGGAIGLVLYAGRDDEGALSRPSGSMAVVAASVRPPAHAFGEAVVAEVVLVADRALVKPESVRLTPEFAPYEAAGPVQVRRTQAGSSVRWRFRYQLRCLREGCAPEGARRFFEFPLTTVVYRFRSSPGPGSAIVDWPRFEVTALVGTESLTPQSWRADVTSLPDVTYRWAPGTLAAALLSGSVAFAALGVGIVWFNSRRREKEILETDEVEAARPQTPLELAFELARDVSRNGDSPERRRALERVARELGARGLGELAERARALAWASGAANPRAIDDLADDARAAANGDPR